MPEDQNSHLLAFVESENWLLPTCCLCDCFTWLLCAWTVPRPSLGAIQTDAGHEAAWLCAGQKQELGTRRDAVHSWLQGNEQT